MNSKQFLIDITRLMKKNQHITGTTRTGRDDGVRRGDKFAEICSIIYIILVDKGGELNSLRPYLMDQYSSHHMFGARLKLEF